MSDVRKLTPAEFQAVGFVPGYCNFDAAACMKLNTWLEKELTPLEPRSDKWWAAARRVRDHAVIHLKINEFD